MKKIIALALALCLTVSMVSMVSAVSFTDDAQIDQKNTEAVTVLSEMGIIGGMGDGTFAPNGTLTRAQAAKIICCMLLGADKANALTASGAKFSDVPASHWAAKFVNYCADKGIVSGIGNGKFGPSNKLTGFAFAKMLLVAAAGFNAETEGLVGASWEKNTASLLASTRLNMGVTVTSEGMLRQNACHLALNCLFYGENESPDDTLAYKVFQVTRASGKPDKANYRRPTTIYSSDEPDTYWAEYDLSLTASPFFVNPSGAVSGGKIYQICGNTEVPTDSLTISRNGMVFLPANFVNNIIKSNTDAFDRTMTGITLEAYYDAPNDFYSFIIISPSAGVITSVTEAVKLSDGTVLEQGTVSLDNGLTFESSDFNLADVGGWAIFYGAGKSTWNAIETPYYAVRPTIVTGVLSAYKEDATATVGGKTYTFNGRHATVTGSKYIAAGGAIGDTVHVVLDKNGIAYALYK